MRTEERLWRQLIRAILRKSGASFDDLEDLCQEVAIAYFETRGAAPWEDNHPQPRLVAYLVKSALSDYFARLRRHSQLVERYTLHVSLNRMHDDLRTEEEVADYLSELPPDVRDIIEMKIFDGYTFSEISDLTFCPESTVKARYYKGIAILRKILQQDTTFGNPQRIYIIEEKIQDTELADDNASQDAPEDRSTADGAGGGG